MKHGKRKQEHLRKHLKSTEINFLFLKYYCYNEQIKNNIKSKIFIKYLKKLNNNYKTKINNQCIYSYNYRSVYRKFSLNRHYLKKKFNKGHVNKYRKSS